VKVKPMEITWFYIILSLNAMYGFCGSRKFPYLQTLRRVIEIPRERGWGLKIQIFLKESMMVNWNFQRDSGKGDVN